MPVILVTGMSGTGTTSVLEELQRRGYRSIDTDYDGWCVDAGGDVIFDEQRMRSLIASSGAETVFVSGCVSTQFTFDFAATVLLSSPEDVILERVARRTNNSYGSTPEDRAEISANLRWIEPLLRATCEVELDATRPIPELADAVERIAHAGS